MALSSLIKFFVTEANNNVENDILAELTSGRSKLLDVVECLGLYLTSTELSERSRSTQLLSSLLHKLPTGALQENEVEVLVTFHCDRIKDHHSIQPYVLYGMSALCQCTNISATSIHQIMRQINKELHIQSLSLKDRKYYYTMVLHLLTNRLTDCQKMEAEFVYCYMQAMDSEKDPRHLLLAFQCVTIIAQNFPLGVFAEDLFEVVACYFPIDFTPPPNDPHGIKKEDLILGLKEAMSASPRFAEFCLPLLLEKASSSIPSAKISAFQTLTACASVYGSVALKEYLGSFWSAIQREVILPYSPAVENAALEALTAVTATLATQKGNQLLQGFIQEAFQDTRRHINEPEQKLALPNAHLLETICRSAEAACVQINSLLIPMLLGLYASHPQVHPRRVILEIIVNCIKTVKEHNFTKDTNPLNKYSEDLYPLLVSVINDRSPQLRGLGITGVVGLLALEDFLTETQTTNISQFLLHVVTQDEDQDVRKEAIGALTYMSSKFPAVIKEHVLNSLIASVKGESMEVGGGESTPSHMTQEYLLTVMSCLATDTDLVIHIVPVFTHYLKCLHEDETVSDSVVKDACICCRCLCSVVVNNIKNDSCRDYFYNKLITQCFALVACVAMSKTDDDMSTKNKLLHNVDVLRSLASVVRNIVCHLQEEQCEKLVNLAVNAFLGKENPWAENCNAFNITKNHSVQQRKLVVFLSAVISSLPKHVQVPSSPDIEHWLYSLCAEESEVHTDAAKCLAALFNKYANSDVKLEDETSALGRLYTVYRDKNRDVQDRLSVFRALQWMTKAAVLASHRIQYQLTDLVIQALKDANFSRCAADGFYVILSECEDVMSVDMHADVKIMYRQRFFHITMPKIIEGFTQAHNECKPHYLTALSYLLRFVPKEVLMAELPPVMPLLIQSLQLEEQPELWLSSLSTLYDLMHDTPDTFHTHVSDLVPTLLTLAKYPHKMKVRVSSIQCLGLMTTLPTHMLLPHRPQVLKQLARGLDDHKRLVRKEAALARGEWFLLGQPGGKK